MDQVTQQNAALVEEAAAAAQAMQEQAGSLVQAVSVFRLAETRNCFARAADKQKSKHNAPTGQSQMSNVHPALTGLTGLGVAAARS